MYTEIEGDLISLAKAGLFDVICHGVNCFCTQKAGIAVAMAEAFKTNIYPLESSSSKGDINKLGQIDYMYVKPSTGLPLPSYHEKLGITLAVVNAYTQYEYGGKHPFCLDAFNLCMMKINHIFKGKHLGMPMIGAGLGGGNWVEIEYCIKNTCRDINVTVVKYKP